MSEEEAQEDFANELAEQTEDLCHIHNHPTKIIANLDFPLDKFSDYDEPNRATFDLRSMIQVFLYKEVRSFDQMETVRRLRGAAYIFIKFNLPRPPTQGGLSATWRKRFDASDRLRIKSAAAKIRTICETHDIVDRGEPPLEPEDIQGEDIGEQQIVDAVERASRLGFSELPDPRGSNSRYALKAYLERQGYLNMARAGTTTERRRFARLSPRTEVPHGSSHNRTLKKIADPAHQTNLWDFTDGTQPADWRRIRDTVLPAFHRGVENMLDEITEADRVAVREPVNAAFDITTWPFYASPFRDESGIKPCDEPVTIEPRNGSPYDVYPCEDYPEMVSGIKESHQRAFKFATLTIVADDTPLVLAIEPVRDVRRWEDQEDVDTRTRGELIDDLLDQAKQHVDINKVYADREFDSYEVRHRINQHDVFYVIGKRNQANEDRVAITKTIEHEVADVSVEQGTLTYEGETHDISFIYVPKDTAKDNDDYIEGDYAIFTVNAHVSPDRAMGLAGTYRDRWMIENEYKTIKAHFLPTSASKDYRNRFLIFVIGVMMYNVWRLSNFLLREEVDVNLGENPPILAGEIVELIGFCLFDPGG